MQPTTLVLVGQQALQGVADALLDEAVPGGEDAQRGLGLGLEKPVQRLVVADVIQEPLDDGHHPLVSGLVVRLGERAYHGPAGEVPDDLAQQPVAAAALAVQGGPAHSEFRGEGAHVEAALGLVGSQGSIEDACGHGPRGPNALRQELR
ncbi:MAG: hypothetical protein GEV03_06870 [Streptosporangiales bacterium]|nr:hypothetical protein [Streptosporangiales bacterium]